MQGKLDAVLVHEIRMPEEIGWEKACQNDKSGQKADQLHRRASPLKYDDGIG
jgi:hypothetical protein